MTDRVSRDLPRIIAIDPGPQRSALVAFDGRRVVAALTEPTDDIAGELRDALTGAGGPLQAFVAGANGAVHVVVEMIACYGMAVGREVFETCVWIGRLKEIALIEPLGGVGTVYADMFRRDVKLHLCNSVKAKDANVRQALIDRFGGKQAAIGTKKAPGPLYGIKGDEWAALGVAVTYASHITTP